MGRWCRRWPPCLSPLLRKYFLSPEHVLSGVQVRYKDELDVAEGGVSRKEKIGEGGLAKCWRKTEKDKAEPLSW